MNARKVSTLGLAALVLVSSTALAKAPGKKKARTKKAVVTVAAAVETPSTSPSSPAPSAATAPSPSAPASAPASVAPATGTPTSPPPSNVPVSPAPKPEPTASTAPAGTPTSPPAAVPSGAPAGADKRVDAPAAPTGGLFEFSAGVMYTGGSMASGVTLGTLEAVFALRGGYFFSPHVGLIGGVEGGYGHLTTGCSDGSGKDSDECGSVSVKAPVLVQYAVDNRRRGAYFEGGVTAFNFYALTASDQVVTMFSPVDFSAGAGIRAPLSADPKAEPSVLDFHVRADVGMFTSGSYSDSKVSASGDIQDKALHYAITLNVGRQF